LDSSIAIRGFLGQRLVKPILEKPLPAKAALAPLKNTQKEPVLVKAALQ